ncbi:MAG: hypothetical protein E4G90_10600 [Gemmatimonadales bacterium]|nr:MAG: hypothetical protein E4G90_10600 [Gemmatimonadales bacterium]
MLQLPMFTDAKFQPRTRSEIVTAARAEVYNLSPGYGLPVPVIAERVGITIDLLEKLADEIVAPKRLYLADGMFCLEDTGPDPMDAAWDAVLNGPFDGDPADLVCF